VIDTGSRHVCAISCISDCYKLLFICVPFEDKDANIEEFYFQLSVIENLLKTNAECLVVCGGDFNVDFHRDWAHPRFLINFCEHVSLWRASEHSCCTVGYTYNLNMLRFQDVDQFVLSELFFSKCSY